MRLPRYLLADKLDIVGSGPDIRSKSEAQSASFLHMVFAPLLRAVSVIV